MCLEELQFKWENFDTGPGFEPQISRSLAWHSTTWAILVQLHSIAFRREVWTCTINGFLNLYIGMVTMCITKTSSDLQKFLFNCMLKTNSVLTEMHLVHNCYKLCSIGDSSFKSFTRFFSYSLLVNDILWCVSLHSLRKSLFYPIMILAVLSFLVLLWKCFVQ